MATFVNDTCKSVIKLTSVPLSSSDLPWVGAIFQPTSSTNKDFKPNTNACLALLWLNFILGLDYFPLSLAMVMCDNEFETKEK